MILFSELQMQGDKHVVVNSGLLQILLLSYPNEDFILNADNLHMDNLLNSINSANRITTYKRFAYHPEEDRKTLILYKIFRQTILALSLFKKAKREKAKFIVFTSVFPFVAWFLNFFSGWFKQKIIVCQHGDLGVLLLDKQKITTKIFRWAIISFLKKRNTKYNTFLFYGATIKEKLCLTYPQFSYENVITIDHPYHYDSSIMPSDLSFPVVFANIGNTTLAKRSNLFFDIASLCSIFITQRRMKFLQIGSITPEITPYINSSVEVLWANSEFIPSKIFEQAISDSNYFLYFFNKDGYYDLCPSGTFFDAVKNLKPIIALRTNWFEYYFSKLGNIGYLCDSIEEMRMLMEDIANKKRENDYKVQVDNLIKAQTSLSINGIVLSIIPQLIRNHL